MRSSIVVVVALCVASATAQNWPFKMEDCGGRNAIAKFDKLDVSPKPLLVQKENKYDVSAAGDLTADLPEDAYIQMNIQRSQKIFTRTFNFSLPCLSEVIGSCTLKFKDYFNNKHINEAACDVLKAAGKPCSPALKAGRYEFNALPMEFKIGFSVPQIIASLGNVRTLKCWQKC